METESSEPVDKIDGINEQTQEPAVSSQQEQCEEMNSTTGQTELSLETNKDDIAADTGKNQDIENHEATVSSESNQMEDEDDTLDESGVEWTLESKLQSFLKWCDENDLKLSPKVTVNYEGTSHRYGMVAISEINKGEELFTVPRNMVLNADNSLIANRVIDFSHWLEDEMDKSLDDSSGWVPLLLTLMYEYSKKPSFWAPYLRLIPSSEEFGHPFFWNAAEQVKNLQGLGLLLDVARDNKMMEFEYKEYVLPFMQHNADIFKRPEMYSLDLYKRMVAFVMSYSFTEDDTPSMVPMADILNHHAENNAHLLFATNCLKMVSLKKIEKGEEVYNTFGKLGNAELLQMYGYVEPTGNPYDAVPITLYSIMEYMLTCAKVSKPYVQAMFAFLDKTRISPSDEFFLFDKNGLRYGPDILQMFKILHMSEKEFEHVLLQRAGHREDSFYKKLYRKVKVEKKTDDSSGVTVIDITEEETEETETAEDECEDNSETEKRKIIELQDNDEEDDYENDGASPAKRPRLVNGIGCHGDSNSEEFSKLLLQKKHLIDQNVSSSLGGNTLSDAIVIDDDDEDDNDEEEKTKENIDNNQSDKAISADVDEKLELNTREKIEEKTDNRPEDGVSKVTDNLGNPTEGISDVVSESPSNSASMDCSDIPTANHEENNDEKQLSSKNCKDVESSPNKDNTTTTSPVNNVESSSVASPTDTETPTDTSISKSLADKAILPSCTDIDSHNVINEKTILDEKKSTETSLGDKEAILTGFSSVPDEKPVDNCESVISNTVSNIVDKISKTSTDSVSHTIPVDEKQSEMAVNKGAGSHEEKGDTIKSPDRDQEQKRDFSEPPPELETPIDTLKDDKIEKPDSLIKANELATTTEDSLCNNNDTIISSTTELKAEEAAEVMLTDEKVDNKMGNKDKKEEELEVEEEEEGDVEFLSEDIGCIYTYEKLRESLPIEHRETLKGKKVLHKTLTSKIRLIQSHITAINFAKQLDTPETIATDEMSMNERNSHVIRLGHYKILKKCLETL